MNKKITTIIILAVIGLVTFFYALNSDIADKNKENPTADYSLLTPLAPLTII